jgi:hypothetical protein
MTTNKRAKQAARARMEREGVSYSEALRRERMAEGKCACGLSLPTHPHLRAWRMHHCSCGLNWVPSADRSRFQPERLS